MCIINLPFGRSRFVCDICGYMLPHENGLQQHEAIGVVETTELRVGETVELFGRCWQGDRFVGLSEDKESLQIEAIFYSEPGFVTLESPYPHDPLPPHTLCVTLIHPLHSGSGCVTHSLTYRDLQLWQEGNRSKLLAAGLVKEPLPQSSLSRRMWKKVLSYA